MLSRLRFPFSGHLKLIGLALTIIVSSVQGADRAHITILSTTDLHGNISPLSYYTNRPAQLGLAKIATLIKQARKENPQLILLDSGDTIQGTPLAYYHNRKNNQPPDPMMLAMNSLRYDAMAIGNHEYNFGRGILEKARREASFPWLSGNTYKTGTDETAYQPYIIKEIDGVRVGIIGLTTAGVPSWEDPKNFAGLEFREPVGEAKKWVRVLREKEQADVVVVSMHMGLDYDLATGKPEPGQVPYENCARQIAQEVSGIDLILMGHTHTEVSSLVINGVLLSQANKWGDRLVRADLYLDKSDAGRWQLSAKSARTIPVTEAVAADEELVKIAEPYNRETQAWLSQPLGNCAKELLATDSRLRDTALLDLIQRVQLEAGQADVSMAASFSLTARVPQGTVTVRDIYGLYIYENTLVVIEATGAQLKAALEHSARYFGRYEAGRTPTELIDERIPGYNFDTAEGVSYILDLTRPQGDRIVDLRFKDRPLAPDQKLRLAINNYRLNGGGGYTMYKEAPVLFRSNVEIRDLILDWVERHREIPAEPSENWKLSPAP